MVVGLKYFSAIALFSMAPWLSLNNAFRSVSRGSRRFFVSDAGGRQYGQDSKKYIKTTLEAKKRANGEENPAIPAGWTTIKYGTEEDAKNAEMDDRIREAERWVSKKLTDKESQELNRVMGIEAEVLAALAAEEDELSGKKSKKDSSKGKQPVGAEKLAAKNKLKDFLTAETRDAAKVKGFLELNPYICSGCGTPFQSKSTDTPGFLPKDKIKVHLVKAQKIRDKQEAIKILELAGIEVSIEHLRPFYCVSSIRKFINKILDYKLVFIRSLLSRLTSSFNAQMDSEAAEEILKEANISDDVIAGVRALSKGQSMIDQVIADFLKGLLKFHFLSYST